MNTQMIVRSEEKVLVEALGSRKQIGKEIFFEKRPGYEYPVAEMDRTIAKPLLHGEKLTEWGRDELKRKLAEAEKKNVVIDEYNLNKPPGTPFRPRVTVPEIYHGFNINFREAVPIKVTGKKKATVKAGSDSVDIDQPAPPVLADMTWGELRKLAVNNGVNIQGKKRPDIEAELLGLNLGV